jgi:predicted peroxiredoxin
LVPKIARQRFGACDSSRQTAHPGEDAVADQKSFLVNCSWGKDNAERATVAFIVASVAAAANRNIAVFLTIEGVRLATRGYADGVAKEGYKPVAELLNAFLESGGKLWVCGACASARQITKDDLIEGAAITGAMTVVDYAGSGAVTLM